MEAINLTLSEVIKYREKKKVADMRKIVWFPKLGGVAQEIKVWFQEIMIKIFHTLKLNSENIFEISSKSFSSILHKTV